MAWRRPCTWARAAQHGLDFPPALGLVMKGVMGMLPAPTGPSVHCPRLSHANPPQGQPAHHAKSLQYIWKVNAKSG